MGVTQEEGQALLAKMASGPVSMTMILTKTMEERQTFNVIAETDSGRDDNVVMLGAHLASVGDGPGINDNGSGSAAILETAVQLGKVNKLNNKVRFAWWGAEELGLLGSDHDVTDLQANDPASGLFTGAAGVKTPEEVEMFGGETGPVDHGDQRQVQPWHVGQAGPDRHPGRPRGRLTGATR